MVRYWPDSVLRGLRSRLVVFGIVVVVICTTLRVSAQVLTCTTGGTDRCAWVHYHFQTWDLNTKGYVELYGTNRFATLASCEKAKDHDAEEFQSLQKELVKLDQRLKPQPNRYGPCHCDMTENTGAAHFLDQPKRDAQLRRFRELELDLLDEFLKRGVVLDSDIARSLISRPGSALRSSVWPQEVVVPAEAADRSIDGSKNKLKSTSVTVVTGSGQPGSKLELAEVRFDRFLLTVPLEPVESVDQQPTFLDIEMKRVTSLLEVAMQGSGDESLLEEANQRIQLLTNLGKVNEVGGARSALARLIVSADSDAERLELVHMLFGEQIGSKWNAITATEMRIDLVPEVVTDPTGVLRDSSGRYSREVRQTAVFALLAMTPSLTESQEVWLSGIISQFLGEGSK